MYFDFLYRYSTDTVLFLSKMKTENDLIIKICKLIDECSYE